MYALQLSFVMLKYADLSIFVYTHVYFIFVYFKREEFKKTICLVKTTV